MSHEDAMTTKKSRVLMGSARPPTTQETGQKRDRKTEEKSSRGEHMEVER
jgi:hypothetical protein